MKHWLRTIVTVILSLGSLVADCGKTTTTAFTPTKTITSANTASFTTVITSLTTSTNRARTVTKTSSSVVASTSTMSSLTTSISLEDELTEWNSTMLASESNIVFGSGVGAMIAGKNYLICTVDFGNNPEGTGTNADAGIIISDISNPDNPEEISYLKTGQDKRLLSVGQENSSF